MLSPLDEFLPRSGSRTPSLGFDAPFPPPAPPGPQSPPALLSPSSAEDSAYGRRPRSPITKRVDHVFYETTSKINVNPWSTPPEFLKVFSDEFVPLNGRVEWECVLFGNPRPRISWYFNDAKLKHEDVEVENHCDTVRVRIRKVRNEHYGQYTIIAENEVGQANATAFLRRPEA